MKQFDVMIVGAGLSGIGAAVHLQSRCPGKTYTILEGRAALGGTWDLFRYPGIRSDSDMHTFGYGFKPWTSDASIADGHAIRSYLAETAHENGIDRHIRFQHKVVSAEWSSQESRWHIEALRTEGEQTETISFTCRFLFMCTGYYRYDKGFTPEIEGLGDFQGHVIHPQHWPNESDDFDYAGKRVAIIGSGAAAVTLLPAMAKTAAHVTMVQRSPTYILSRPSQDRIANALRKLLPERLAYRLTRFKNIQLQRYLYAKSRTDPQRVKEWLFKLAREALGPHTGIDFDKHFIPAYNPWDQRLCLAPDGDFFHALREGRASIVTGQIDRITPSGIRMQSGEQIDAEILVTATGLNLTILGGTHLSVDGRPVDFSKTLTYKGMLYSDIPNFAQTSGYLNASWTLRADLTAEYVCRLLNRMDEIGAQQVTPRLRPEEADMPSRPWIEGFDPGYIERVRHLMPRQGDRAPWRNLQNYARDKKMIRSAPLEDGALIFESASSAHSQL